MIRFIQLCIALLVIVFFDLYIYENLPWVDDITRYKVNFQYPVVYAINSNLNTPIWAIFVLFLLETLNLSIEEAVTSIQYIIFCSLTIILSFATRSILFTVLLISSLFITYYSSASLLFFTSHYLLSFFFTRLYYAMASLFIIVYYSLFITHYICCSLFASTIY